MSSRKPPDTRLSYGLFGLETAARPSRQAADVFQIPPEYRDGIRIGREQIRRGEVLDEPAWRALLKPRSR